MKKLTTLEHQALVNITKSEYISHRGVEVIGDSVWSFSVTNSTKKLAGALGSLAKKGFVSCSGNVGSDDETVSMTKAGYEAMIAFSVNESTNL